MTINRRGLTLAGAGAIGLVLAGAIQPASANGDEAAVKQNVEAFRKAMLTNDKAQLEALSAPQLSYGHSAGKIENKAEFVAGALKATWKSIALSDETVAVVGNSAVSRFVFTGQNVGADGKPNDIKLAILMVWQKQDGHWKLLARQAARI